MTAAARLDRCTELLQRVLRFDQPADALVSAYFRSHRELGARDRQVLAETVYAVLRRRPTWLHLARSGSGPLERRLCLLAWQGPFDALQAALKPDERDWIEQARQADAALPDAVRHHLPPWLAEALRAELPEAEFQDLARALIEPAPLDLRVNVACCKRDAALRELAEAGIACLPTRWSPWGIRVDGKPSLASLPLMQQGKIDVQDEGSQLLALLTGAGRGEMVVDFCAGAGGKTLALGAMMRNTGRLYAFDVSAHRLDALSPRLARSGLSNVHAAVLAHERDERVGRLAGKIDRVLVDAPCSGLGTLRRHPDLKWRQTPQTVQESTVRQEAILASAARLLRPGGRLVYATCSLLRAENEEVASAFSHAHGDAFEPVPVAALLQAAGISNAQALAADGALRLWPHRHGTDGFFAAVWQRR